MRAIESSTPLKRVHALLNHVRALLKREKHPEGSAAKTPGIGPEEVRLMSIVIYTKDSCPYCAMAKQLLQSKGVEWTEINIDMNRQD